MRLKFGVCILMGVIWFMCQFLPQQLSEFWAYVFQRIAGCLYYGVYMCYIRLITDNPTCIPTCPMTGLGVCTVVHNMAYVIAYMPHITDF